MKNTIISIFFQIGVNIVGLPRYFVSYYQTEPSLSRLFKPEQIIKRNSLIIN